MSFSTLKPVPCRLSPVVGENASLSKVSKVTMLNKQVPPPLQVKGKEKSKLQERSSRREVLQHLTAASVGLVCLQFPASAEAASVGEMITQKLEELQQKFGLAKPKDESAAKPKVENGGLEEHPKPKDETAAKPKIEENSAKEPNPKPKDESAAKPKIEENSAKEANPKPKNESTAKPKVENGVKEKTTLTSSAQDAVVPAPPGIINGSKS